MKLLKDSFVYLIGELFAKALPFLLLPYLTRKLGASGFGELSYYQTWLALLMLVFGLSQEGAVARYFYFYGKRNLNTLVHSGYAYTLLCSVLGLLFSAVMQSPLFAILTLTAATQAMLGVQLSLRQCRKQALPYVLIQSASGICVSLFTVLFLELSNSEPVFYRFLAVFAGNSLVIASTVFLFRNASSRTRFSRTRFLLSLRYVFAFGTPLLLHSLSNWAKGQFDRFILFHYYPADELGIYSAAFQLASVLGIALMALNKAAVPHYFQALREQRINTTHIHRWAIRALLLAPLAAFAAWLLPAGLFEQAFGSGYQGMHGYTVLFAFGFALNLPYFILVNPLFYQGSNRTIAQCSLFSTLVYLGVLFAATPFGTHYAPLAMIAGNLIILPVLFHQTKKAGL